MNIVPIPTFPGYGVTEDGRVWSCKRGEWVELIPSRNWSSRCSGYFKVKLYRGQLGYQLKVHHLVAEAFLGPRPNNLVVNHKDGNKVNNRVENLEYVTYAENSRHAYATGLNVPRPGLKGPLNPNWRPRQPNGPGEQSPQHKLTTADVLEMRRLHGEGNTSTRALASMFGVSQPTVCRVVKRIKWRHV